MSTHFILRVCCVAILTTFGHQSLAQTAVSFGINSSFSAVPTVDPAAEAPKQAPGTTPQAPMNGQNAPATSGLNLQPPVDHADTSYAAPSPSANDLSERPKLAVLLPPVNSPFDAVNDAVIRGIEAVNATQAKPMQILPLHRKAGQTALSQLQDAALLGAVVAIGPMTRDEVSEMARLPFLPLPVVALNHPQQQGDRSDLMINFSLSQEEEAKQIAQIAIRALPATTSQGEKPKVIIFEVNSSLEQRVASAYAQELEAAQIPFERVTLTQELMNQPRFYESLQSTLPKPKLEALPDKTEDPYNYNRVKARNEKLMEQYRAQQIFAEPPYYAALLAMDARTAALVSPRLPRLTRVWGTSLVNPGDPRQSVIASLTYDLTNVGFVDAPLAIENDIEAFRQQFGCEPPSGVLQRRLFAFGVDAYRLAQDWMHWKTQIRFDGSTGSIYFDAFVSNSVLREAEPAIIKANKIEPQSVEKLLQPITRPQ